MKYKVVISTLFIDGVKYKRGDIVETDKDFGTRVEPYVEVKAHKPKRKRRTKAEIARDALSAAEMEAANAVLQDIPVIGGSDED